MHHREPGRGVSNSRPLRFPYWTDACLKASNDLHISPRRGWHEREKIHLVNSGFVNAGFATETGRGKLADWFGLGVTRGLMI